METQQTFIAAEKMGRAVMFDPQFALPTRPRYTKEVSIIPLADGMLIDGTDDWQVLRGPATKSLLPRLLPLLDGTRGLAELPAALPSTSPTAIHNALSLLYTRGLLEDSAADPAIETPVAPHTLAFFRRYVDATRANRSARQALDRLAQAHLVVYTFGSHADLIWQTLATQVKEVGVQHVERATYDGTFTLPDAAGAGPKLVVVVGDGTPPGWLVDLDDACARQHIGWLQGQFDTQNGLIELGPYFEREETACYSCYVDTTAPSAPPAPPDPADALYHVRTMTGLVSSEIISLLSRISPAATGLSVTRYSIADWQTTRLRVPKVPGCPRCRPVDGLEPLADIPAAVVYEDAVSFPSRHLLDPKGHQIHYRASNLELTHAGKRYPSAAHIALPRGRDLPHPEGETFAHGAGNHSPARTRLDLNALAMLLAVGSGVRRPEAEKGGKLQRWSATGGNLGSVEMYVLAYAVEGLPPGTYFYQPQEHNLAQIASDQNAEIIAHRIADTVPSLGYTPDALLIFAAAHHRVMHKYGPFAYRIVNLDAGVALGQVHLTASGLGIQTRTATRWADAGLEEWLDLETLQEPITAVVSVTGRAAHKEEQR